MAHRVLAAFTVVASSLSVSAAFAERQEAASASGVSLDLPPSDARFVAIHAPPTRAVETTRGHHGFWGDSQYRSPGLAFALSLTPLPIDFGNLYAENVPWGVVYTTAELALGTSMVWVGAGGACHRGDCNDWSDGERQTMLALASGYVLVKLIAGTHAMFAAEQYNELHVTTTMPLVAPTRDGAALLWQAYF